MHNLIARLREELEDGGLRGSFLVRDLHTGQEIGIDPDRELPNASLVKVPLAAATLDRIRRGELDGATPVDIRPGGVTTPGPTGLTRFRHPARVAVDDLLYLSIAISDGAATDALFELTPPAQVTAMLRDWGLPGITARHPIGELMDTPAERFGRGEIHLAHSLAIDSATAGQGHPVPQLDISRASAGSARAFVNLLEALWTPSKIDPMVAGRVRELMAENLMRQRLTPDFASDASRWSSKTGTLLNLRHEVGVVEHADGQSFAVRSPHRVSRAGRHPARGRGAHGPGRPHPPRPPARCLSTLRHGVTTRHPPCASSTRCNQCAAYKARARGAMKPSSPMRSRPRRRLRSYVSG